MKKSLILKPTLMAWLLIPVAVAINIVGFQLVTLLKLPIYLDTIGTVLIGIVCGPIMAALAGFITNAVNAIFNPVYLPYSVVSICVGLAVGICARKGMFCKLWKVIIVALIVPVVSTFSSSPITVLVFGGGTGHATTALTAFLMSTGEKIWTSVITVQFFSEIADKALAVFIAWFIVLRMPDRYLSKLPLGSFYLGIFRKKQEATLDIEDETEDRPNRSDTTGE